MRKSRRKKTARGTPEIPVSPVAATFDETNQLLKIKFSVKHINYVTNNSIIRYGWLVSNMEAINEAISLLKVQTAPIYILGEHASVIVSWDAIRLHMLGHLWKNGKEVEKFMTSDFDEVKHKLVEWFKIVMGIDPTAV